MKKFFSTLIMILTFMLVFFVVFKKFSLLKTSFLEHKIYYLGIGLAYIGGRLLDGLRFKLLLKHFGMDVKLYESFGLSSMSPFYNLIFPNAGTVTNAVYLKSKYNFRVRHSVSIGLIESVSALLVYGVIGIIGSVLYMLKVHSGILFGLILIYGALVFFSVIIFFIPTPNFFKKYHFGAKIIEAIDGFKNIKLQTRIVLLTVVIQITIAMLFLYRYYLTFNALLLNTPIINITAIIPVTAISNLINILPANIGIREIVTSSASMVIGFSLDKGLLVAVIDRVVITAITVIAGIWFFVKLKYSDNLVINKSSAKKADTDE